MVASADIVSMSLLVILLPWKRTNVPENWWFRWFFLSKNDPLSGDIHSFSGVYLFLCLIYHNGSLSSTIRVLYAPWLHECCFISRIEHIFFHETYLAVFFPTPNIYVSTLKIPPEKLTRLDSELPSWQLKHAKLPAAKLGIKNDHPNISWKNIWVSKTKPT